MLPEIQGVGEIGIPKPYLMMSMTMYSLLP